MVEKIFTQVQQNMGLWRKAWEDHLGRVSALCDEMGKAETKGIEQASAAIDEATRMTRESIAYTTLLSAEWRKLSLEAAKRTADMMSFPG